MRFLLPGVLKTVSVLIVVVIIFVVQGCDSNAELLTNSEQESLNKIRSGKFTLISNEELSALKQEAETAKNVGRYQIHREGFRTWRLDTTTGYTCLLLTSVQDWKKPETQLSSCGSN
jgi:hypothetical protein